RETQSRPGTQACKGLRCNIRGEWAERPFSRRPELRSSEEAARAGGSAACMVKNVERRRADRARRRAKGCAVIFVENGRNAHSAADRSCEAAKSRRGPAGQRPAW
ncbi:MAG: hypothetical protein SOX32_12185, partial [Candidatus Choladocola sp.]|nr:hypothetical protein [Candidatus Choladocola sp.]